MDINAVVAVEAVSAVPAVADAIPAVVIAAVASIPIAPIVIPNPITEASLARPEISGIFKLFTLLLRSSISFYKVVIFVSNVVMSVFIDVILIPYDVIRFYILVIVFDVKVFNVY